MLSGQREDCCGVNVFRFVSRPFIGVGSILGSNSSGGKRKEGLAEREDGLHCKFSESHFSVVGKDNQSCPELS